MKRACATLTLLACGGVASAGGYGHGYYGYSYYYPSYSYYPGYAYQSNAYYYPATTYYSYPSYPTYSQPTYQQPAAPAYSADWKTEVLKVTKARDEIAAYQKALTALGVSPPVYPPTGPAAPGGIPPNPNYGTFGANGSSLYGYTYETVRSQYGDLNLNTLYQQAARLAQQSQQMGAQATTEFGGLVDQAGDRSARVAEIMARGAALSQAWKATEPQAQTVTTTRQTYAGTAAVQPAPDPAAPAPAYQQSRPAAAPGDVDGAQALRVQACGQCHGADKPKAGFNVHQWAQLDPKRRGEVRKWLLDQKADSTCDGNKPGKVSVEQMQALLSD